MKRFVLSLSLLCLFFGGTARSQERVARVSKPNAPSLQDISPDTAADIWFYEQQWQRYDDPKRAVRRNAEFRAAQRRYRLAAMAWYGFSNSWPTVSPLPFMGVYSPTWASSHADPYRWVGGGCPTVALHVREVRVTR